jgi:hypothetical protein
MKRKILWKWGRVHTFGNDRNNSPAVSARIYVWSYILVTSLSGKQHFLTSLSEYSSKTFCFFRQTKMTIKTQFLQQDGEQTHFSQFTEVLKGRGSANGISSTSYRLDDRAVGVRAPIGSRFFHFPMSPRPALGLTQPIEWVLGLFLEGKSVRGVKLTTHSN